MTYQHSKFDVIQTIHNYDIFYAMILCVQELDGIECQQMQRVEMDDWPVFMEPSCDTLFMCFITTFKEGIRAGGGISDVLRKPAKLPYENEEGKGEINREKKL